MSMRLRLELAPAPLAIPTARGAVTRLCRELRIKDVFASDVRLAVTEACTTCVLHGCREGPESGTLLLEASVGEESLVIVVRDGAETVVGDSCEVDAVATRLIGRLADDLDVSPEASGRMRVAMRFALSRRASSGKVPQTA
jgi:anti-sigma regulatory factor (Ser/Thr protein kinase)